MKKLRFHIMKLFILCSLGLMIADAAWTDSCEMWIIPALGHERLGLSLALMLLGDILLFLAFAGLFYWRVSQRIANLQEEERQASNLLYANIAHDLKTPLTSIRGYSRALSDGLVAEPRRGDVYEKIERKSRQANDLLDLVFSYAKLEAGGREMPSEKIDPSLTLRALIASYYEEFEEKGLELELDIAPEMEPVLIHEDELKRVLENLTINTIRHNRTRAKVCIRARKRWIRWEDNGETISPERFEELKKPFARAGETRQEEGSGLGLAICESILSRYGYKLSARPAESPYRKAIEVEF